LLFSRCSTGIKPIFTNSAGLVEYQLAEADAAPNRKLHHIMQMQTQTNPQTELPLLLLLETVVVHIAADIRWRRR
jgi:hypothetical protein